MNVLNRDLRDGDTDQSQRKNGDKQGTHGDRLYHGWQRGDHHRASDTNLDATRDKCTEVKNREAITLQRANINVFSWQLKKRGPSGRYAARLCKTSSPAQCLIACCPHRLVKESTQFAARELGTSSGLQMLLQRTRGKLSQDPIRREFARLMGRTRKD